MGKASKWFRSLLSSKKSPESSPAKEKTKKGKWLLTGSGENSGNPKSRAEDPMASPYVEGIDANKHAIAVAAATAAVAEAALAAAQAAAEVVRLTSSGGRSGRGGVSGDRRPVAAAVKIQSAFRAYLARRALRALKGLVKLQALVRGHIVRKQSADMLRRMQAMARIQARASAHRSYTTEFPIAKTNFSNFHHPGNLNTRKYEERLNSAVNGGSLLKPNHSRSCIVNKENSQIASRWLNHWMEQCAWEKNLRETSLDNDERSDKILEIDTWKPRLNNTRNDRNTPISQYFSAWNNAGPDHTKTPKHLKPNPSVSSEDVSSLGDQVPTTRTSNNPTGSFTPARSECSRSLFGDYLGHRGYMANTESSRAKVRSHSAPKQRMQLEELGLSASAYGRDFWESDTVSERGSFLPVSHRGGGYRYSGQVKRQGTPTRDAGVGVSSIYGRRI